jgi:hypothetical protein
LFFGVNSDEGITYTWTETETLGDLDLKLKAGWNVVYTKGVESITYTGTYENPISITSTETYNVSLGNPSNLKWTTYEYNNYSVMLDNSILPETIKTLRQMRQNR